MAATRSSGNSDPVLEYRKWAEKAYKGELPKLLVILSPSSEEEPWFGEQICKIARQYLISQNGMDFLDLDGNSPDFDINTLDGFLNSPSLFATSQALIFSRASKVLNRYPRLADRLIELSESNDGPSPIIVHCGSSSGAGVKILSGTRKKAVNKARFRKLYSDPPPWKPDPDSSEAARFVASEAALMNLKLHRGTPGLLVSLAGSSPSDLVQALKHFEMMGLKDITEEKVREIASHSAEGSAFDFADAIFVGDSPKALSILKKMSRHGVRTWGGKSISIRDAFPIVVSSLTNELLKMRKVLDYLSTNPRDLSGAIESTGGRANKPVLAKIQKRLAVCDTAYLNLVSQSIMSSEKRLKIEGWRDPVKILELFIISTFKKKN
jgi:hypothetical protein